MDPECHVAPFKIISLQYYVIYNLQIQQKTPEVLYGPIYLLQGQDYPRKHANMSKSL